MLQHPAGTVTRTTPGGGLAHRSQPVETPSEGPILAHYAAAARAVICFVLYGEQVIREITVNAEGSALRTFSLLPIPTTCRPDTTIPRRGNPAPVSSSGVVDAHGVLAYSAAVGGVLAGSGGPSAGESREEQVAGNQVDVFRRDRMALGRLADTLSVSRPAETFYKEYWQEAERLLRTHWLGVEMLAEVLSRHPVLTGERIDKVLCEAFPV
ncbi:MAG: hypothetical protein P8Q97_15905 [Myxococcota bacterium]|nr:hypothetical protein [Myxococcota bacterium]